jgi:hypothetical protein
MTRSIKRDPEMAMNGERFEQEMKRQTPRPVPADWRQEILSAACEANDSRGRAREVAAGWWGGWVGFRRLAWGGLGAAWVLILGLNWAANRPGGAGSVEAVFSPGVVALAWQQSQQIAAGLDRAESSEPRAVGTERPRSAVTTFELRAV